MFLNFFSFSILFYLNFLWNSFDQLEVKSVIQLNRMKQPMIKTLTQVCRFDGALWKFGKFFCLTRGIFYCRISPYVNSSQTKQSMMYVQGNYSTVKPERNKTALWTPNFWLLLTSGRSSEEVLYTKLKLGLQNCGLCRQVVNVQKWPLAQVWLYLFQGNIFLQLAFFGTPGQTKMLKMPILALKSRRQTNILTS